MTPGRVGRWRTGEVRISSAGQAALVPDTSTPLKIHMEPGGQSDLLSITKYFGNLWTILTIVITKKTNCWRAVRGHTRVNLGVHTRLTGPSSPGKAIQIDSDGRRSF